MPQSLVKNYLHLVWSTKNRERLIDKNIKAELYNYLAGISINLESPILQIGGVEDHVHILCLLSRKIALMKLVEELKSHSSKWIKTKGAAYQNFYWQNGYGGFSVRPSEIDVDVVINYIKNQETHHAKKTFKEEYRMFLNKYKMEFDERYVWD